MNFFELLMRHPFETVKRLLFPARCPVCDGIVRDFGSRICAECSSGFKLLTAPWCMCCGRKMASAGEFCPECQKGRIHNFRRARALYDYRSAAKSIYRFKYGGRREYGAFFGEQMAKYLEEFIRNVHPDGLIPIPLHRKRMMKRGYNQAEILAKELGKCLNIPVLDKILVRTKNTAPLKDQNSKERQNNLKKAFLVRQNDVKLKTIILIDDIYTTGSTVDEAAAALQACGIPDIYVVTLAGSEVF